jgi:hypothetical protein
MALDLHLKQASERKADHTNFAAISMIHLEASTAGGLFL